MVNLTTDSPGNLLTAFADGPDGSKRVSGNASEIVKVWDDNNLCAGKWSLSFRLVCWEAERRQLLDEPAQVCRVVEIVEAECRQRSCAVGGRDSP